MEKSKNILRDHSYFILLMLLTLGVIIGVSSVFFPVTVAIALAVAVLFIVFLWFFFKGVYPALLTTIFLIPLLPKIPLIPVSGSSVAIRVDDFLMLLLVAYWLYDFIIFQREIPSNPFNKPILVFLLVGICSTLLGVLFLQQSTLLSLMYVLRRLEYLTLFFIVITTVKSRNQLLQLLKIMLVASGIVALLGVLQVMGLTAFLYKYTQGAVDFGADYYRAEIVSTFSGNYDLAAYFLLMIPLVLCFMMLPKTKRILPLPLLFFLLLINSYVFLVAGARTPIIAMLAVLFLMSLFKGRAVFIVVVFLLLLGVVFTPESHKQRIADGIQSIGSTQGNIVDSSLGLRLSIQWPRAREAFLANPLFGSGLSSVGTAVDGNYLRILAETGLLGLSAFFWIILVFLQLFVKMYTRKDVHEPYTSIVLGIFLAVSGLLLDALFIDIFESSKIAAYLWILFGLMICIYGGFQELSSAKHFTKNFI